ncbi:MAG: hypothetical protein M3428_00600 [Pseudomonadota bacterium]|nr:hypothetical protein [Sphingomonas sp.]MDQ3470878.1 hypothetical protein [Pseudomonadota bacterium]
MPRFFFHIYDDGIARDADGRDFPDAEAAKREAIKGARELMCEQVREGRLALNHRVEIEDDTGNRVATLRFGDLVQIES